MPGLGSRPVPVEFVAERVTLGQDLPQVFQFYIIIINPKILHTH
jgi:hypothetical protein